MTNQLTKTNGIPMMLASKGKVCMGVASYKTPAMPAAAEVAKKPRDSINPNAIPWFAALTARPEQAALISHIVVMPPKKKNAIPDKNG